MTDSTHQSTFEMWLLCLSIFVMAPKNVFLLYSSDTRFCQQNDPGWAQEQVVAHRQQNSGRSRWIVCGAGSAIGGLSGIGIRAHRVIGGLPHFRLQGVDSPSHWLQSLGAKWQSVDHLQQYFRPGHYFVTFEILIFNILRFLLDKFFVFSSTRAQPCSFS